MSTRSIIHKNTIKIWKFSISVFSSSNKYSVRDGDTGLLFSEEFSQGFQQLQNSFSIPSTVILNDVVGEAAYTNLIKNNLESLDKSVTTRAILEKYKIQRHLNAIYDDFYNHGGGWGL